MSDSGSDDSETPKPLAGAVFVGNSNVHRAKDRYGEGAENVHETREHRNAYVSGAAFGSNTEWPWVDEEDDGVELTGAHIFEEIPDVQLWRMNLTALSQSFPLYFGAFKGRIFVYTISTAMTDGHFIQRFPDIQLVTQPTSKGRDIGGTIDPEKGHIINHMIAGFLGDQEIVAAVFDNGDVAAYSIPAIWAEVERRSKDPGPKQPQPFALTTPFFHDNVYDSAWGLAIHRQSGLLAVSTNRHEVTVFAFAETQISSNGECEGCENGLEDQVRRRARLWRVVIDFGWEASNLPNIAFVDDEDGEAMAVCAIDIDGKTWISPIWTYAKSVYALSPRAEGVRDKRGWGVLPLPLEAFMVVTSSEDLLGGRNVTYNIEDRPDDVDVETSFQGSMPSVHDSHENILDVPDNPCLQDLKAYVTTHLKSYVRVMRRKGSFHPYFKTVAEDVARALADGDWSDLLFRSLELEAESQEQTAEDDDGDEDEDMDGHGEIEEFIEHDDIEEGQEDIWPASATSHETTPANMISLSVQDGEERLATVTDELAERSARNNGMQINESGVSASYCCGADYQVSEGSCVLLPMTYFPSQKRFTSSDLRFASLSGRSSVHYNLLPRSLWKRYRFFTTYISSLVLLAPEPHLKETDAPADVEIRFSKVIGPYSNLSMHTLEGFRFHHGMRRLNMLHYVPELSLLVIGSSTGRVILVTPTRMAHRDRTRRDWDFGFRVEAILPRASDEEAYGLAREPLHGIAVGPVHYGEEQPLEKRYLLTMHFRNHDIVTYELGREAHRERTVIF